ncbi:MAG: hypothetical protein V1888_02205 [archaeon]
MTLEMHFTELESFVVQYGKDIVDTLNKANSKTTFGHLKLREVAKQVPGFMKGEMFPETEDGYSWFEKLEFDRFGKRVAVLFPWCWDSRNPESIQDRSINVYSDGVKYEDVKKLLSEIAYQITLNAI